MKKLPKLSMKKSKKFDFKKGIKFDFKNMFKFKLGNIAKFNIKMSLKVKLVMSFLLLISIPVAMLGTLSYNMSSSALQSSVEQQLIQIADLTAESINTKLADTTESLQIAAQNAILATALTSSQDPVILKSTQDYILALKKKLPQLETIFIADMTGNAVVTNDAVNSGLNLSDREYFRQAVGGRASMSEIITSKVTNKKVVAVAVPITSNNVMVGVLGASVDFASLSKHAAELRIGENGRAFMIDKNGLFVHHPVKEKILAENIKDVKSKDLQVIVKKMLAGEKGTGFYTEDNTYKFVRYVPVGQWILGITANYDEYMKPATTIRQSTLLIAVLCLAAAMLIAYLISNRSIVAPIKKLQALMGKAGMGDLTVAAAIHTRDEIQDLAESFNQMIKHQNEIVGQVRDGAQELAASSEEMAAATEEISASTEQVNISIQSVAIGAQTQNSSIVETSQALMQLAGLVQKAKDKANDTNRNAEATVITAGVGRDKVKDTVQAIGTINTSTVETMEVLNILDTLSSKVGGITVTINSLAEQTNLLALNAAIEAARAGEHGRGFAVVADEVRKLSEQSNKGAHEIESLVNEMIAQTRRAVKSINTGKSAVDNGVKIAEETDNAFLNIIGAVQKIVENIGEIVDITNDEVATSDQIVALLDNVSAIAENTSDSTQEVAAAIQEQSATVQTVAATAEEMSAMAVTLDNLVKKFNID